MTSQYTLTTASTFATYARRIGVTTPSSITALLRPDAHPRARLNAWTEDVPSVPEAMHAALNAGKNPVTDKDVQRAVTAQAVRANTGDLGAVHAGRVAAAFREAWDEIIDAVTAVFDPAAEAFTRAHALLKEKGVSHDNPDQIRRIGGDTLAAWGQALTAEEIIKVTPTVLTNAHIAGHPTQYGQGRRAYWTITPNLDTWAEEGAPDMKNPWTVLDSGATLSLARSSREAEDRVRLVSRERQIAANARANSSSRGGFGAGDTTPITYVGADGVTRQTDSLGAIRRVPGRDYIVSNRVDMATGESL